MSDVRFKVGSAGDIAPDALVSDFGSFDVGTGRYLLSDGKSLVDPIPALLLPGEQSLIQIGQKQSVDNLALENGGPRRLDFITSAGLNGNTVPITGVNKFDLIVGMAVKPTNTAPGFDDTVGQKLIASYSGLGSASLAFWKYAETDNPPFGVYPDATRCQYWAYRMWPRPQNPIGAVFRAANTSGQPFVWAGLTLEQLLSQVVTLAARAANESITPRPGAVVSSGISGTTLRYYPMRSNGVVSSWPAETVAQSVAGAGQTLAVEIGWPTPQEAG